MKEIKLTERHSTVDRFEIADRVEQAGRLVEGIRWAGEQLEGVDCPDSAAVIFEELSQAVFVELREIELELYPADKFPERKPAIKLRGPLLKIA